MRCRSHTSLWAALGTLGTLVIMSAPAAADQPLKGASDFETLCRHSEPVSTRSADADETATRSTYQRDRRRLVQATYEVVLPSLEDSVLGYDRVTGVLSVSGFKDHSLVEGRYHLRFREACGLYFEMDEGRARDLVTRAQLGGVSLKVGFHLDPHDDYDRPICVQEAVESESAEQESRERTIIRVDLLYARLVEPDGTVLASFQTELDHDLHLRRVSQAIGAASAVTPRVELTSLRHEGSSEEEPWQQLEQGRAWWQHELETSVFPCYIRGLRRNGRLQGAMVVRIPAGNESPDLILDTVQEEEVAGCIIERVEEVRRRSPDPQDWGWLKATFLLKLD
ncbi:MAG: hypothetical protein ACNA8W_05975 [Bradymonadaceae bacterium]